MMSTRSAVSRFRGVTRRQLVGGSAAFLASAGALRLAPGAAAQEASPVPVTAPDLRGAIYEVPVGDITCYNVSDGASVNEGALAFTFGGSPSDEVQAALTEAGYHPSTTITGTIPTVIDTGDQRILIDTGYGPGTAPGHGLLIDNLALLDLTPDDIDILLITHAHGDHIGGNVLPEGGPRFANARHIIAQAEWDFWTDTAAVEEAVPVPDFRELLLTFVNAQLVPLEDQLEFIGIDSETEIAPGVVAVPTPGHTPGHLAVRVESGADSFWIGSDAALHDINVPYPHFVGLPDVNPEQMIETRRELFSRIADEGSLATFYHFDPFPGTGQIVADGDTWAWLPVEAEPAATPTA